MEKKKIIEFIYYGIIGICTTIVNYLIYCLCLSIHWHWFFANTIAWCGAVIFAYISNRKFVFHSHNCIKNELWTFLQLRFVTLIIENVSLALFIDLLSIPNMISKIIVSIVTVISNYWLCKTHIFTQKEGIIYE